MIKVVEGTHLGFFHQILQKRARRQADGEWETPAAEEFIREAGTQLAAKYIGRRKETVAQWVDLRTLLEVCTWDTGYEGGVRKRQPGRK